MRYSEIKTMGELESAQRNVRERLNRRKLAMRESLLDAREAFTPSNMLFSGLPVEKLLLAAVRLLKHRIFK